ncbi:hypothetical protein QVD17_27761 [Tagetes erecta]|uniref:Uncharacterized protein n=1 Tax=Tagetes erecta TaxID=13708 RepID=A0AAD8KCI6_TARER|nr:hypothetical protein QVD17_27761 [Tagetes erecta]
MMRVLSNFIISSFLGATVGYNPPCCLLLEREKQDFREKNQESFYSQMEDFRSKSYNANGMQIQPYNNPNLQDFRCYSTSHASSSHTQIDQNEPKFKKHSSKSTNGSMSKSWSFGDPELQRKKRVASYKAYTVEGKVKGSIKKSFRWIKDKYTQMVYGLRS